MEFINDSDHFDQHFLKDNKIIETFINECNLSSEDTVVEIGPGKGNISSEIAKRVAKLYCIELDERLKPFLDKLVLENNNVEIIWGSALDVHIPTCNKIITCLPYSIVEPFIHKISYCKFDEAIMITGERFASNVVNKETNMLSLYTNCYFESEKVLDILPEAFEPAPRVLSSIIKLKPIKEEDIKDFNLLFFRYMFFFKGKKIKNALVESLIKIYNTRYNEVLTQKNSKEIINNLNIDESILGKTFETCSNDELKILYKLVKALEK